MARAQVLQWTSFCNTHVDPAAATGAKANGVTVLKTINEHLSANTHLVANRLSLADIMVSTAVQPILVRAGRSRGLHALLCPGSLPNP
jgi:glutathione S-transferase